MISLTLGLDVLGPGVDRVRRAEGARGFKLVVGDVDGDDRRGAGDPRALHRIQADAAAADDDDAAAGADPRRVDHGAVAGQHAAGDQRGDVERHVFGDALNLAVMDDDMLGEGADAHAVDDALAAGAVQRALLIEREHLLALHRRAAGAGGAEAAGADQRRHHGIADLDPRHAGADRLDDPRRLVAVDRRQRAAPGAFPKEHVAVADRARLDLDADLALAGLGEVDLLERERLAEGAADGGAGFHGEAPN